MSNFELEENFREWWAAQGYAAKPNPHTVTIATAWASTLLEQRHPTPVPVSERLPGPEDCDAEGRCWWGFEETDDYEASWTLRKMIGLPFDDTHWLPANALPLPQGEVE